MFNDSKPTRDLAKFFVFSHLGVSVLSVILSGIVASFINFYYQYNVSAMKVDITDIKTIKMGLSVALVATAINLPLTLCATTFFHEIASRGYRERVGIKDFFEPFSRPVYLLKGTLLMFILALFNTVGILLLVFPVYLSFCMAPFILKSNPDMSVFKALSTSFKMMYGHKMTAFKTIVPIMGVYLLCGLFAGVFYLFGFLAMAVTQAVFNVTIAVIYNAINAKEQYKDILLTRIRNTPPVEFTDATDEERDEERDESGEDDNDGNE